MFVQSSGILIFFAARAICCWHRIDRSSVPVETFEKVLKSKTYADKSGLIKEFLESPDPLYITAPPGFGKSTALNMVRAFAEIEVDKNGTRVEAETTRSFHLFQDKQLEICHDKKFYDEHFGQYPVLHFQLKFLVAGNTWSEFERFFRGVIVVTAKEHAYLLDSTTLSASQKALYKQIHDKDIQKAPEHVVKDLTALLHAHFKRKCLVLIDDFDSVLTQILSSQKLSLSESLEILNALQKFLTGVMKDNEHIKNGLVMASVRMGPSAPPVSQVSSPPAIVNGVRTIGFGEKENIAKFFGFSEKEVSELAQKFGKDKQMDSITKWYGGYTVHNSKLKLYNMNSVTQYLTSGNLTVHRSEFDQIDSLKYMFDYQIIGDEVQTSLSRDTIRILLESHPAQMFAVGTIHELYKEVIAYRKSNGTTDIDRTDLFLKYLIDHGYYTIWQETRNLDDRLVSAVIPNYETRSELEYYIFKPTLFRTKFGIPKEAETEFINSILNLTMAETGYIRFAKSVSLLYQNVTNVVNAPEIIRMLSVFADYSRKFDFVMRKFLLDKGEGVNLVIITKKSEEPKVPATGILIRINIREFSALGALSEIVNRKYYTVFEDDLKEFPVKNKILIGVHISDNKTCSLSYLDNSLHLSDARSKSSLSTMW